MKEQRVAVIGYGMWGRNIVRNFYNLINPSCLVTLNSPDQYVIQVKDDSTIHFVKVKQGRDLGDRIEILEGLKGDELLVTNIKDDLKEGQKVKYQK